MKSVVITGALGGIGQALCKLFSENQYSIIGIDNASRTNIPYCDVSYNFDLNRLSNDPTYKSKVLEELQKHGFSLKALINNAAVQLLDKTEDIKIGDWQKSLSVNLTAPMILSQWAIPFLKRNSGCIINISSIHQSLTKRKFVSYATTKSALVGLTKSMAVDLNGVVRVNSISPAAIETDMLKAGFNNNLAAIEALKKLHPSQKIGNPIEVASLAYFLTKKESEFINGANIQLDGGISSVLHDL